MKTELPGSMALYCALKNQKWPQSMDAEVWVDEWMKTIQKHPEIPTDRATMISWFSNAIMAGYDTAAFRFGNSSSTSPTSSS